MKKAKCNGITMPEFWSDLPVSALLKIDPAKEAYVNGSRIMGISAKELNIFQIGQMAFHWVWLTETDALTEKADMTVSAFGEYKFGQWVDGMQLLKDTTENEGYNEYLLAYELTEIFNCQGENALECFWNFNSLLKHCKETQDKINARQLPSDQMSQRAAAGKFEQYEFYGYIMALAKGNGLKIQDAKNLTINEAVLALHYEASEAQYRYELDRIIRQNQKSS